MPAPPATFVAEPSDGTKRFGALEVIGKLATGGMATVYLCRLAGEAGFQRLFAVKALHPHLATDEAFVSMLMDEARIAARLHHPHAVGIVDIGVQDGAHYLVMDYVEGCSVSEMLRVQRDGSAIGLFVRVVVDALNGLEAAHTLVDDHERPLGLIHRDVSPQNILIGTDGNGWITDFGIAKARARITSTQPGVFKGKICYLAPELLLPPHHYDHRVDVFAAGAVLWSVLTGRKLFQGETDSVTAHNILHKAVPKPSSVGWRPPECFDAICLRALARNPDERYQSAAELASELRAAGLDAGVIASPFEVAAWVKSTFKEELEARHEAIRRLSEPGAKRTPLQSLPLIPPVSRADNTPPQITPSDIVLLDDDVPTGPAEMAALVATSEAPARIVPKRRWIRIAFAGGLLLVAAIVVPAVLFSGAGPSDAAPSPAATAPVTLAPPSAPELARAPAPSSSGMVEISQGPRAPPPIETPGSRGNARSPGERRPPVGQATNPKPTPAAEAPSARVRPPLPPAPGQTVIEKNPYLK